MLSLSILFSSPGLLFAQAVATPTAPATVPSINDLDIVCPAGGCIDDPTQQSLIQQLREWIYDALHGGQNLIQRFFQLIKKLFLYLMSVLFQIDRQVEATKCHNPDCSDYGYHTPTPGG